MRGFSVLSKSFQARLASSPVSAGFSLIEMSLVIMIVGIMIAMFAPAYKIYQMNMAHQVTKTNLSYAQSAIAEFRRKYGRYPLPASSTIIRGEAGYGYESKWNGSGTPDGMPFVNDQSSFTDNPDWDNAADPASSGVAYTVNGCANGICVRHSARLLGDFDGDGLEDPVRIRIGMLPFRVLNLEENEVFDGYGNRLTYAMVERLGRTTTYDDTYGAIGLRDLQGNSLLTNATTGADEDSAHFVVFSHGQNAVGAYTRGTFQINCDMTTVDLANTTCDGAGGPPIFIIDVAAVGYDDIFANFMSEPPSSWKVSEDNPNDIFANPMGAIGIMKNNPQDKLDVAGAIESTGNFKADQFCDNIADVNCFQTALIAGAEQEGLNKCPANQFMVGIKNGRVVCQSSVDIACPEGEVMQGITVEGAPSCLTPPDCPASTVTLCGTTYTVPSANFFDTPFTNTVGSAVMTSTCSSGTGTWQHVQSGGACPSATCAVKATGFVGSQTTGPVVGSTCTCGSSVPVCRRLSPAPTKGVGCSCGPV